MHPWDRGQGHHRDVDWVETDSTTAILGALATQSLSLLLGSTSTGQIPMTNVTLGGGSFYRELCPLIKPQQAPWPGALERAEWQHRDQEGSPSPTPTPSGDVPIPRDHHGHWLQVKAETAADHRLPQSIQLRHSGAPALSKVLQGTLGKWRARTSQVSVTQWRQDKGGAQQCEPEKRQSLQAQQPPAGFIIRGLWWPS